MPLDPKQFSGHADDKAESLISTRGRVVSDVYDPLHGNTLLPGFRPWS